MLICLYKLCHYSIYKIFLLKMDPNRSYKIDKESNRIDKKNNIFIKKLKKYADLILKNNL